MIDPAAAAASGASSGAPPSGFGALPLPAGRSPEAVAPGLWLFAPNRDTQGGSAWLLETADRDLLIDCPALSEANLAFLAGRGPQLGAGQGGTVRQGWIVLSGRSGHGRCRRLQERLGWPVVVQEQEAYLLPGVAPLHSFAAELELAPGMRLLWTPGPGPGSCVLHVAAGVSAAGDGLFCGRLLVPVGPDRLAPLRSRSTFHWPRQLRSLERLHRLLPPGSPHWIASGAALGALRGGRLVHGGAALLARTVPDQDAAAVPL